MSNLFQYLQYTIFSYIRNHPILGYYVVTTTSCDDIVVLINADEYTEQHH